MSAHQRNPNDIDALVFARTIGDFVVSIAIFITTQGISAWILPQP
jgi:hypothetical protein